LAFTRRAGTHCAQEVLARGLDGGGSRQIHDHCATNGASRDSRGNGQCRDAIVQLHLFILA
jgi:hypothetical protein